MPADDARFFLILPQVPTAYVTPKSRVAERCRGRLTAAIRKSLRIFRLAVYNARLIPMTNTAAGSAVCLKTLNDEPEIQQLLAGPGVCSRFSECKSSWSFQLAF